MKDFDGHNYTERSVLEELLLIERHARDGSAVTAGCACIEEKHLLTLAGLSSEMPTLSKEDAEKEYYMKLAEWARSKREEILDHNFKVKGNPATREFLPHGLTKCEKSHPEVKKDLASCIEQAEIKCCGEHTTDYGGCTCNPVAVCRAAVPCP
jgi:hypothetical protein